MSDVQCDACGEYGYMSPNAEVPDGWTLVGEVITHEWRVFRYCPKHEVAIVPAEVQAP